MANIVSSNLAADDIAYYLQQYNTAAQAEDVHRRRGIRNLMAYAGIDDGMLSDKTRSDLKQEGRHANTYNFIRVIVSGHVGNYVMNAIDPKFIDREDDNVDAFNAVAALQKKWFVEKDKYNYKAVAIKSFEQGLIYRGIEEICIDEPSPDPRTHGIRFDNVRFDCMVFDPDNLTDDVAKNSRKCWKVSYLSESQLIKLFPEKEAEIKTRASEKSTAPRYDEKQVDSFSSLGAAKKFGNRPQVIEYYHIEEEKVTRQFFQDILLPETGFPLNSPENIAIQTDWAMRKGIVLTPDSIYNIKSYVPKLYLTTFVPCFGVVLQNKLDRRQFGQYLPFSDFSFMVQAGISIGLVDFIYGPNDDLNKREMAKIKQLTQAPVNKMWISEDIVPEGSDKKLNDYVAEASDISKPYITPAGIPGSNLFGIMPGAQLNQGLLQDIAEKTEFINRLGSLPPAMQGIPGNSAESGIAVGRRVIEGSILQRLQMENYIKHMHHKTRLWVKLALSLFGGTANVNRSFRNADGSVTVLNEFMGYDEDGQEIVRNNLSELRDVEVTIIEAKENDYLKQAQREMDVAALMAIPPSATNDPIRSVFESSLAMRMDFTDEMEKERAEEMCNLRLALAKKTAEAQLVQLDASIASTQMQMMQMQNPQPAPVPAPAPAPGGGPGVTIPLTAQEDKAMVNAERANVPEVQREASTAEVPI